MQYKPVIGLEIHAGLNTRTKMFCDSFNDPDEKTPNTNVCPICMGHPGTLPVINDVAVKKVILAGLAMDCAIEHDTFFERKNYFYPDLPKGYQISQYLKPLCYDGKLKLKSGKTVRVTRIHLEEDAGKLLHDQGKGEGSREAGIASDFSVVDYNRAGVPLMELVTEPDFETGEEVREFAQELQLILRYLNVSDADMEKGLMRVEVNISLTNADGSYGTKVEIKNLNSISAAANSVDYEIKRQRELLEKGEKIIQETRGWDDGKKATFSQRSKEEAHDYRYFPEPDLPPLHFDDKDIEKIRAELPELPAARRERLKTQYDLTDAAAAMFASDRKLGTYFEKVAANFKGKELYKLAANYLITELQKHNLDLEKTHVQPEQFADLMVWISQKEISSSAAQTVIEEMVKTGKSPEDIINEKDLGQVSDSGALEAAVDNVIAANQKAVDDYKKGKETSLKFLVGMAMRESKGKGNPQVLEEMIKNRLQ